MSASVRGGLFDLSGKVALVTGAGAGIGRAIVEGFAEQGADALICDIDDAGMAETIRLIEAQGRCGYGLHCDVSVPEQRNALFAELDNRFGRIDILVNNVGHVRRGRPEELPQSDLEFTLQTGVLASFAIAQAAAQRMIAAGHGGSIINISSIAGVTALGRGNLTHSANKGAVNQMTRELAVEWAHFGIRVNAILPCQVLTEGFKQWMTMPTFDERIHRRMLDGIPMNRMATPREMAGPAIFLASDAAAMVTGTLLGVDGGNLAMNAGGSHTW
jgi:NAD(P)-dependent dehydrogenase (short-subunit alcohol dehydrogenase family)